MLSKEHGNAGDYLTGYAYKARTEMALSHEELDLILEGLTALRAITRSKVRSIDEKTSASRKNRAVVLLQQRIRDRFEPDLALTNEALGVLYPEAIALAKELNHDLSVS